MKPRMTKRYKWYEVWVLYGDSWGWMCEAQFSTKREAESCCTEVRKEGYTPYIYKREIPPVEIVE